MEITKKDALLLSNVIFAFVSKKDVSCETEEQLEELVGRLTQFLGIELDRDNDEDACPNCGEDESCCCDEEPDEEEEDEDESDEDFCSLCIRNNVEMCGGCEYTEDEHCTLCCENGERCDCEDPDCKKCNNEEDFVADGTVSAQDLSNLPILNVTTEDDEKAKLDFALNNPIECIVKSDTTETYYQNVKHVTRCSKSIHIFNGEKLIKFNVKKYPKEWTKFLKIDSTFKIEE